MQFVDVDPSEINNFREGRRGRVSYPILKSFLETNKYLVMLDRTGIQQSFQSLYSCLNSYITNHALPIKIFSRGGQIYLCRTDINEDGTLKDAVKTPEEAAAAMPAPRLSMEEVQTRFDQEIGKSTK